MPTKLLPKQLSVVSTKWDAENKGYLSAVQQTMRDLDEKGTGTLSADQLSIFATKLEVVSSENKQLKKLILGLGLLVVVLFASTLIGTTRAIKANKEISVTPDGLAVAPSTGLPLRTEAQGFAAESTYVLDEETGITHECVSAIDVAEMYVAYGKGMTVTYKGMAGDLEDVDENTAPIHVASGGAYVGKEHVQFGEAIKFNISSPECDRLLGMPAGVSTDGSGRKLSEQLTFSQVLENVQARRRKLNEWEPTTTTTQQQNTANNVGFAGKLSNFINNNDISETVATATSWTYTDAYTSSSWGQVQDAFYWP